jgi:hypothetical protein
MEFLMANWVSILAAWFALDKLAGIVVKITPTNTDNEILKKIRGVFKVIGLAFPDIKNYSAEK